MTYYQFFLIFEIEIEIVHEVLNQTIKAIVTQQKLKPYAERSVATFS